MNDFDKNFAPSPEAFSALLTFINLSDVDQLWQASCILKSLVEFTNLNKECYEEEEDESQEE